MAGKSLGVQFFELLNDDGSRLVYRHTVDGGAGSWHDLGEVWSWAGQFRIKDTNIGVAWYQIPEQLLKLCANVTYWQENNSWSPDEIAVRFHHKLVQIHPFPNGNGRHARLVADLMAQQQGRAPFSWGRHAIGVSGETRDRYLKALRLADRHQIEHYQLFQKQ